jgi:EAL domain-containing protein (putative c-di-GMP-specific phosphodiesterase class I)
LKVIAEGIESARHWELLCELGCDLGQAYFFSQPVDPEAASRLLTQSNRHLQARVAEA